MLNKLQKICTPLLLTPCARFGSSHGAAVHVDINKQATWIKFKTNRKLACIDGYEYTHVKLPEFLEQDPIPHVRNAPWYDLERFFYGDLFHHSLDHQAYSTGRQGYVIGDQPNESRFDMIVPGIYAFAITALLIVLREYSNINAVMTPQDMISEADNIERMADERLRAKINKLRELQGQQDI